VFAQGEIEQFHASGNHPRPRARRGGRKLLLHVNFAMVAHHQMPAFAQMMLHLPLPPFAPSLCFGKVALERRTACGCCDAVCHNFLACIFEIVVQLLICHVPNSMCTLFFFAFLVALMIRELF